jgi:hypothetical protein
MSERESKEKGVSGQLRKKERNLCSYAWSKEQEVNAMTGNKSVGLLKGK